MRAVGLLVLLVILLAAIFFSMANQQDVFLGLWPLNIKIATPLFAPILGGVALGFLIGWAGSWIKNRAVRKQLRSAMRQCLDAQAEIDQLKADLKTAESDQSTGRDVAA